ncbi:MAG: LuxR C-terminal-related transcriptional regulator, partial [Chloroflexi bacterium]|nr:LuxR C-terminal-related transcriptional regulator [Chloroflexota bacterium]
AIVASVSRDVSLSEEVLDWTEANRSTVPPLYLHALLGNIYRGLGRYEDSFAEFEKALTIVRTISVTDTGRGATDYGLILRQRGEARDFERIRQLHDEVSEIARSHPIAAFDFWEGQLAEALATGAGRSSNPAGLTAREVEVLRILAGGGSNREIAERLFISQHTVNRHVSNIFSKAGCANRSEATLFAVRNRIVD